MRTAYRLSTAIGNLSWVEVVICHSNPMAPDCRCLDVFCIVWGYDTLVHSLFSDTFIWFYMVSRLLWILLYIVMNYRLLLAFQSFDFELPEEGYFELPDEGYSRNASCALNYISTFLLYERLVLSWKWLISSLQGTNI